MLIPVRYVESPQIEELRCMRDLLQNAHSNDYNSEKGFKQKFIDLLYKLGYYKDNESIFSYMKGEKKK